MSKPISDNTLFINISQLIEESKQQVAVAVNATMSMLYWKIGFQINRDVLQNSRGEYGVQIVRELVSKLSSQYGSGWGGKQLGHCIRFAETFPNEAIVSTLWRQLGWSHLKLVIYMDDPFKMELTAVVSVPTNHLTLKLMTLGVSGLCG